MARIWMSGWEQNTTSIDEEWTNYTGSPTLDTSTVRSGLRSLRVTSLSSTVKKGAIYGFAAGAIDGPIFFRICLRVTTLPSAENRIIVLSSDDNFAAAQIVYITLSDTGALSLYDEDGQIGSASSAITTGEWHIVEIQFDRTPAAGSEVVRARLNLVEFAGSATRSLSAGVRGLQVGGNLIGEAQTTGDWYFDDVAINNSTGSSQTGYPGDGHLIIQRPDSAGDNTDWARGGADTGGNWSQVDEDNPNDGTDFVEENTLDGIDDYNLAASPSEIAASDSITLVAVGVRLSGSAADTASYVVRVKAAASGTVAESAAFTPNFTVWVTNNTGSPRNYPLLSYAKPGGSDSWTKADLDNAQVGLRISTGNTNVARITTVWMYVEYVKVSAELPRKTLLGVGL